MAPIPPHSMGLWLLRPTALPRPSTLRAFLGRSNLSTTTSTTAVPLPASHSPSLPYKISRTPSQNLPVYLLAKRGGNLKQTKLRKIEGNINMLRMDLQQALGLEEKEVVTNQLTKQIIIKVGPSSVQRSIERLWEYR